MLSTVEFSRFDTAGVPGCGHGRQDSNPRHPVLETGALTELSYTHKKDGLIRSVGGKQKRRRIGDLPEGGGVAVKRLGSPPGRTIETFV
jgi:hypothetical protein